MADGINLALRRRNMVVFRTIDTEGRRPVVHVDCPWTPAGALPDSSPVEVTVKPGGSVPPATEKVAEAPVLVSSLRSVGSPATTVSVVACEETVPAAELPPWLVEAEGLPPLSATAAVGVGASTLSVRSWVVVPAAFVAETVIGNLLVAEEEGVPAIVAVPSPLSVKVTPGGRVPDSASLGVE